ncbi:hypothetical protein UA08_03815 [Talaromyces atroroseus]|uniref:AB hydrolase-1 domain-containing protein n=1 Tax=Talaromyces atroroseus TaxID=1441469 RepID=A0A225B4G2_TALAT|nr:hypothetical protein UA08_03815 [Talaromyces atroroseus]OKL60817.1 hypothetical protein UA08_03815 [Talaromyces atroroseus]
MASIKPTIAITQARTLTDDALSIGKEVEHLIDQGRTVVVFMHSYGGLVGNEAIPQRLSYSSRRAQGEQGGVLHLFLCTAFLLQKGQTVLSAFGESPNNDIGPDGGFAIKDGASKLFNDLSDAEAKLWESRLVPQSYRVQTTPITGTAYEYIPSTYLTCENDQAVPPQFQEMFATMAKSEVQRCSAGHLAMLSHGDVGGKNCGGG